MRGQGPGAAGNWDHIATSQTHSLGERGDKTPSHPEYSLTGDKHIHGAPLSPTEGVLVPPAPGATDRGTESQEQDIQDRQAVTGGPTRHSCKPCACTSAQDQAIWGTVGLLDSGQGLHARI